MSRKLTYKFVKKHIEKEGYKLISKNYINSKIKMKTMCPNSHIYYVTWNDFNSGRRCIECAGLKKHTIEELKKQTPIYATGYKLLSTTYKNTDIKIEFMCNKGHKFLMAWRCFNRGQRCPYCAGNAKLTIEKIQDKILIIAPGYKLLSTKYINNNTKMKFICDKNHLFEMNWANFITGYRCSECAGIKKYTYEYVKEYFKKENYELLSTEYINTFGKLKVKCTEGHIYYTTWNNFSVGKRCDACRRIYNRGKNHYKWQNYSKEDLENIYNYRNRITFFTSISYSKYKKLINPKKLVRGRNKYHLDHIYSVADGFKYGIQIEVIANPNNLQMLTEFENISKSGKSGCTKQELYLGYYKYELEK